MRRCFPITLAPVVAVAFCLFSGETGTSGKLLASPAVDSLRRAADMCFAERRYAAADSLYRIVLGLDSTDAPVTALLASCAMRTGGFREAVSLYQRALRLDPELRLAYLGLVTCFYELGETKEAAAWAAKVREMLSDSERNDWNKLVREMFPLIAEDGD